MRAVESRLTDVPFLPSLQIQRSQFRIEPYSSAFLKKLFMEMRHGGHSSITY